MTPTPTKKKTKASPFATVKIKCKPLVKAFLENNFGTPVQIPEDCLLEALLSSQLVKSNIRIDDLKDENYPEEVELLISESIFRHDGFNLNNTNMRRFNEAVRKYIRDLWRFSLDGSLIAQAEHINFKKKYFTLLQNSKGDDVAIARRIAAVKRELAGIEMNIQDCIHNVITNFLKLDTEVLKFETVRKDYARYRKRKFKKLVAADLAKKNLVM